MRPVLQVTATSLAAQALSDVQTLGGDRPLSLFALTIAKSGERKSSCDALAMEPVRSFERELSETYREDQMRYKNDQEIWDTIRRDRQNHSGVRPFLALVPFWAAAFSSQSPFLSIRTACSAVTAEKPPVRKRVGG